MKAKRIPYTPEQLHVMFIEKDGRLFWRKSSQGRKAGSEAGTLQSKGYWAVGIGYGKYLRHRLIYLMNTGLQPENIDHINGLEAGDSFENLQSITPGQNVRKSKTSSRNTSGCRGVSRYRGKWRAYICFEGRIHYLGVHSLKSEAAHARIKAEKLLYGAHQPDRRAENV